MTDTTRYIMFTDADLVGRPRLSAGDWTLCTRCGGHHQVRPGEAILLVDGRKQRAPTGEPPGVLFYRCRDGRAFLAAINGVSTLGVKPARTGEIRG